MSAMTSLLMMTACGSQKKTSEEADVTDKAEPKILVAYFSATGTTKAVAEKLATVMDGTLYEITPEIPYTEADLDWRDKESRSTLEMADSLSRPAIKGKLEDMDQYNVVFLGFPVWWYVAPTIINTFIDENDLAGKAIYCFATSGSSPIEPCVEALKKQYPKLDWKGGRLLNNATTETLENWKKEIFD